jgi:hypothetical protein
LLFVTGGVCRPEQQEDIFFFGNPRRETGGIGVFPKFFLSFFHEDRTA